MAMPPSMFSDDMQGMANDRMLMGGLAKSMPQTQGTAAVSDYLDFPQPQQQDLTMGGTQEPKPKSLPTSESFGKGWLKRIKLAQAKHREWSDEGTDYYKLYHGDKDTWRKYSKLADYPLKTISTNPVALNVDNDRDRLLPKNPEFKTAATMPWVWFKGADGQPVRRNNVKAARVYQEVANMLALQLDLRKTIKQAASDSLITNLGVIKVGWDEVESGGISHSSSHLEVDDKIIGYPEESPAHELVRPRFPWITYVPWNRMVIDPLAGNLEQATWWAEEIVAPEATMKNVPKEAGEINTVANVALGEDDEDDMGSMAIRDAKVDSDIKLRKKWEVHYVKAEEAEESGRCFYHFELYSDGTVKNHVKYKYDLDGPVYTFLQFKTLNGDLLGFSQIRYYAEAAANANLMKQLTMDYAIRALPFFVMAAGADKKFVNAVVKGSTGKVVQGHTADARMALAGVGLPQLNPEMFGAVNMASSSEQMMSGRSLNDKLMGGENTATEAKIISTNSGEILQAAVDVLRIFAAKVIKKAVRVYAEMLEDGETYHVPNGKGGFFEHEKQDLICEITVELSWQSSVREDDAVNRKLNMDLLSILINLKTLMPEVSLKPVLEKIVVSSGYDDPSEIIEDPPMPMQKVLEYVGGILAGEQLNIDPNTDWKEKYQELIQFTALVQKDQNLKRLFMTVPGAMQRLLDACGQALQNMKVQGQGVAGGGIPGGGGGAGSQNNRTGQSANAGDMQAGITRSVSNIGGTGAGRMAGV